MYDILITALATPRGSLRRRHHHSAVPTVRVKGAQMLHFRAHGTGVLP